MGFYSEHIPPRVIDKACGTKSAREMRERV